MFSAASTWIIVVVKNVVNPPAAPDHWERTTSHRFINIVLIGDGPYMMKTHVFAQRSRFAAHQLRPPRHVFRCVTASARHRAVWLVADRPRMELRFPEQCREGTV